MPVTADTAHEPRGETRAPQDHFLPSPDVFKAEVVGPEGSAPNYRAAVITEHGGRGGEEEHLNPAVVNLDDCLPDDTCLFCNERCK